MKRNEYIPYLLLAALALLIFALSDYIQWYGDSYLYRFDFGTGKPIESFWEIFPSQYAHYFMMNGRVWAHVLCQGFSALWGQTAFAICNALAYVAFVLLFVRLVGGSWRNIPTLLSCILIILFFTDTSYNANCQIGYIWTSTVTLAFIIQYFRARSNRGYHWWGFILLFLLSLFAGNGNEAIAIGVGAALIFDFLTNFRRLTLAQWIMLIGFGIGGLVLCLSPGIIDRSSSDSANFVYSTYRLLLHSRVLYLFIITIAILRIRKKIDLKAFVSENRFFFAAITTLIVFNYIIGIGVYGRQLLGVELFSAILTIKAMKGRAFPKWAIVVISALVMIIYALKFEYLYDSNKDLKALRMKMESSQDGIIFHDFKKYNSIVRPTEVKDMQYGPYFVIYSILDDMNDKGLFYQSVRHGIDPPPYSINYRIYPTIFKDILNRKDRNFSMKCADGTYFIIQDSSNPATFILHRQINFLGMKFPLHDYTVELKDDYFLNLDSMKVLFEKFEIPFVENTDIEIIK